VINFQYHSPRSLEEAFELLDRHGDDARVMAGGTALVLQMKQRLSQPGHVVGLGRIPGLSEIQWDAVQARIGSMTTHQQIETNPLVKDRLPLLASAFRQASTPRIRSMATLGGGLAHGDPNQDPPPALIALGAQAVVNSSAGERVVPVEDLFVDYFETDLRPGEIMTNIIIPALPAGSAGVYLKFLPRTADDYATVSVAAVVSKGEDDTCRDIRIVLGAVGVTPIRAIEAESVLRGKPLNEKNIHDCGEAVRDAVDPLDDFRGSSSYKRDMAEVFTRRAVQQAALASHQV
jgi:carbon-monoxide dehydrogenase medium subunit